jgi:pimeloyl-ACP methyl ester carboxylesterase
MDGPALGLARCGFRVAAVLWGNRDELLAREHEDDARAIPGSRMIVYEGTGHLVVWEQPDQVTADRKAFMTTLP